MDISVAIILYRTPANGLPNQFRWDPNDYDIILADDQSPEMSEWSQNSGGKKNETGGQLKRTLESRENRPVDGTNKLLSTTAADHLPSCRISYDQDPSEMAIRLASRVLKVDTARCPRAVPVSMWPSEPTTPISQPGEISYSGCSVALFCVPLCHDVQMSENILTAATCQRFALGKSLSLCRNSSTSFDAETRHLLLRLNDWMSDRCLNQKQFLQGLMWRPPAVTRLELCTHNPAHPYESKRCYRSSGSPIFRSHISSTHRQLSDTTELKDEIRLANEFLAKMMAMEKCEVLIMNSLFGSSLPYTVENPQDVVEYYAKGRPKPSQHKFVHPSCNDSSDSYSSVEDYPLHKYAYSGNAAAIKDYLAQGYDANQLDRDSWAPIHYAAWYGQLAAVQTLLNFGSCSVNIKNRNGSTPLHFAAWRGHLYVVELLLSHPGISLDAKDKDGKDPLSLCMSVPKSEWQAIAQLLRSSHKQKGPKVQIDLMDDSNVMVDLSDGPDTTAAVLHEHICEELKLPNSAAKIFAIWICSESLQLQLKGEHRPMQHKKIWKTKILPNFAECLDPSTETPRLVFRRSAHLSVAQEREILSDIRSSGQQDSTDVVASLLFHEAQKNYIRGLYPCSDGDAVLIAATFLQISHGDYDNKKDKHFLTNEKELGKLIPPNKLLNSRSFNWVAKVLQEHKHISKKKGEKISTLQYNFLAFCWNLRVYGCAFFEGQIFVTKGAIRGSLQVHVGVNDLGLHLINFETKTIFKSCPFKVLEWKHPEKRPYLEVRVKENPIDTFTLKSPQANLINTLLTKLSEIANTGRSSSPVRINS